MILKSDGASLIQYNRPCNYGMENERSINPDEIIYVVDKRQEMHFITGIPLRKKDRYRKTGNRTEVFRIWYDERQGRKTI